MQFLHISDTHLGKRIYNLDSREQDVYDAFSQLTDIIKREHVKVVVHTGDLFDVYKPSNKSIKFFIDRVKPLRDSGVAFLNIPGDHDTPKVREEIYTQRILGESLGLIRLLMGDQDPRYYEHVEDNLKVRFYGVRHHSNVSRDSLVNLLNNLKPEGDRNVLMLHQGIKPLLPYDSSWELEIESLPKGFQYYASGHIHTRVLNRMPDGSIFGIAGSPEIMRNEEIEGWKKLGKGAYLVDLSKKEPSVQPINVEVRPQEIIHVDVSEIDKTILDIKSRYVGLQRKPILHIVLEGDSNKKSYAVKKLVELKDIAEHYRYDDRTVDPNMKTVRAEQTGTVSELISGYLKQQGYTQGEVDLILEIINKYDSDDADELLRKFAEGQK
ncbi:exonuclease SbcCD subunit D [Metallosphaera tengchongensis]|uniref:DNA double-strand break repair protein Mre11 n=1 Tax=Metallosphaera tengchongensis TaxID=1532350 RepID=A0A6N0NZC3_9CREN|nr:DNA double-strand break repair protein Mre11 [Metallosphaera tengchongensis]QKR00430.1 exonuclease SbcCD subunit D [Metallosphaera tengchongensis]